MLEQTEVDIPRILGIDIETTGLDPKVDHITEIAWVVKEVGDPKPLVMRTHFVLPGEDFFKSQNYISPSIEMLTKIKMRHLLAGEYLETILNALFNDLLRYRVTHIVAHNGVNFDAPFITAKAKLIPSSNIKDFIEAFANQSWIDTATDLVYPEDCRHTNLMYVAAYFGFVNPFPHSALFDVATMLKVLDQFPFEQVAARARLPWVTLKAHVSFEDRDLAKKRRYSWEVLGGKSYKKTWVKRVKECDVEKEVEEAGFAVSRIEESQ